MLVSGLKNSALFRITSSDSEICSSTHEALLRCLRDMLIKYEKKQGSDKRLEIKTRATQELMHALCNIPKNQREAILSALDHHAEALQGHEHLLSERGNTYALIQQTRGLRVGQVPASLLRYHDLKNKLLGPDTLLDAQQINAIRALDEKQGLTLKMLEIMEVFPIRTGIALAILHEADLLEPQVYAIVLEHKDPPVAAETLLILKKAGLPKAKLSGLCAELCKHEGKDLDRVAYAIVKLCAHKLDTPDNCSAVIKHSEPPDAVNALVLLDKSGLLLPELRAGVLRHKKPYEAVKNLVELKQDKLDTLNNCLALLEQEDTDTALLAIFYLHSCSLLTDINRAQVLKHKKPIPAAMALRILDEAEAGLCIQYLCDEVLKHEVPDDAAEAFVELNQHNLATAANRAAVLKKDYPCIAAKIITHLHSCNLLTDENREQVLKHQFIGVFVKAFKCLGRNLCTQNNFDAVINHPDIYALTSELWALKEAGNLEQSSFEACLVKTRSVAMT